MVKDPRPEWLIKSHIKDINNGSNTRPGQTRDLSTAKKHDNNIYTEQWRLIYQMTLFRHHSNLSMMIKINEYKY
jgi:hypothetical protein